MAVLDLATIITPLKYNFLHIGIFVISVILNLDANLFYLFIICLFIYIYIYIYLCIYSFIYLFIYYLGI